MTKRRRAAREPLENETMVAARERQLSRLLTVVVGSVVGIALLILGVGLFRQTAVVAPESVDHTPVVHPTPVLTPALDFIDIPYWDGVIWRKFQPGMVQPTPVAVPCNVYQPLGSRGWIWDIETGDDGSVWVTGNDGVARLDPLDHTWTTFGQSEGLPTGSVSVRFVTPDINGTAWLAFWNGPLYYFDGERWNRFIGSSDLRPDKVLALSVAPDGSVWFGTTNGAFQWDRKSDAWNHLTKEDGLHSNVVSDILFSPDGKVWFANIEGVSYFDQRNLAGGSDAWWSRSDQPHTDGYEVAMASGDGKVWFGGQRYFDAANQSWADTVYSGFAYDITVDDRGGLWVGIDEGAVYIPDPDHSLPTDWQFFAMANGLGGNSIRSLAVDADGGVWFGAENSTVSRCTFEH